jgi:hypothetical protein
MEKRCSLGFFCFALFIANEPTFAAQIEAITEKDKPLTKESWPDRSIVIGCTSARLSRPANKPKLFAHASDRMSRF